MPEKTDFTFRSTDKKTEIHAIKVMPDGKPKAIVQLVHGMDEYIDRHDDFADFLAQHGYLVIGHDHLGHGDTAATPEDFGYFAEGRGDITLVEDIHKLRLHTQDEPANADLPYFILGHSMGSYLLREYLGLYSDGLAGAIIMGTGDVPDISTDFGIFLCNALARINGWRHRSLAIQSMTYTKSYKRYDVTGRDTSNSWLSKVPSVIEAYRGDPRCTFVFTLNGHLALFESVKAACSLKTINSMAKDLPVLIVSGADDPVGDLGEGVKRVYDKFLGAGMEDVTMKLYENDRHEILHETDSDQVYEDLLGWLDTKTEKAGQRL